MSDHDMPKCARLTAVTALGLCFAIAVANRAEAQNNLSYDSRKGPVMQTPNTVFLIYWLPSGFKFDTSSTVPDGVGNFEQLTQQFFKDVAGTPYFNIVTQYPAQCGSNLCALQNFTGDVQLGGSWVDTTKYTVNGVTVANAGTQANPLQDFDIQQEVTRAINANSWTAGINAAFFVFTGAGVEECKGQNCTFKGSPAFCAYHFNYKLANGSTVLYSYESDASFNTAGCSEGISSPPNGQISSDREVALMSHEFFEMATDPLGTAWWDHTPGAGGNEIGDNCNQQGSAVNLNGQRYAVQKQWSNASSSCVTSYGAGPTNCTVVRLDCQHLATMACDPTPNGLGLAARIANLSPPAEWSGAGFTVGTPATPASVVYDGVIIPGPDIRTETSYQFRACAVNTSGALCVAPVSTDTIVPPSGCPGGPPPPPPPPGGDCCRACIKAGGDCHRSPRGCVCF